MIEKASDEPVGDYLQKLRPIVAAFHGEIEGIIHRSAGLKTAADLMKLDLANFMDSYTQVLAMVTALTFANRELEELLRERVIATKLENAIILADNLATLTTLDPTLIAKVLNRVRRAGIMADALDIVNPEPKGWIIEALKEK